MVLLIVATELFKVGDRVVHPQYGVGDVVNLQNREFDPGIVRQYYEIAIPGGSTVWVPSDMQNSGLRNLTDKREIAQCRKILASHPSPLNEDARYRQTDLAAHLKNGTLVAQCEVVRDLYAYGEHKSLNGTIASFYRTTQDVLFQEWAEVEGITLSEAGVEINTLLEKSRNSVNRKKA